MLIGKHFIPSDGIIQRPVETFSLFTIHSTVSWFRIRSFSRHEVTIMEILETRSNIECISNAKRQFQFRIKNRIECGISFLQFQKLFLVIPVCQIVTVILEHQRVLYIITLIILKYCVWTIFHETTFIHTNFTI